MNNPDNPDNPVNSEKPVNPLNALFKRSGSANPANPANPSPAPTRSELYGTGLTKRVGEKAARDIEFTQTHGSESKIPSIDELDDIVETELPKTLVDPTLRPDEYQQAAIDGLVNQQFGVLIGAAGTGKTTAMKWLIARLLEQHPEMNIAFCAFTGRATQQMKRALPREYHRQCDTIHGLLEYAPVIEEFTNEFGNLDQRRVFQPHRTEANPLTQNCIIVDEAGMVVLELWNNLMRACKEDTRIYLLGDINQLPPPMGRSVLGFAMQAWPAYELARNHRTEEDAIIDGAWEILHGRMPQSIDGRVALVRVDDGSSKSFLQTCAAVQKLHQAGKYHPLRDALIVPQNVGPLGQEHLNERLTPYFNPTHYNEHKMPINPRTIITAGYTHVSYAVGDKIMVTQNDREQGLTNGMIGVIEAIIPNEKFKGEAVGDQAGAHLADDHDVSFDDIDSALSEIQQDEDTQDDREKQASHILRVRFQNIEMPIEFASAGAVNSLKHAYAFTCHKAQGGEYPVVVILCHAANWRMLTREWLYTAWTRAQEKVILLYNSRGLQMALSRQTIKGRTLREKAQSFIDLQNRSNMGDTSVKVPLLPAPVEFKVDAYGNERAEATA